jgi:hypothetical protein
MFTAVDPNFGFQTNFSRLVVAAGHAAA